MPVLRGMIAVHRPHTRLARVRNPLPQKPRSSTVKITRELSATTIRQVSPAGVEIAGTVYTDTLAVTGGVVHERWTDKSVDALTPEDFSGLVADEPDVILLGTGKRVAFAPRELVFSFARSGIGFEVMDTKAAARTFNVLAGEGRRVAAVLFPESGT